MGSFYEEIAKANSEINYMKIKRKNNETGKISTKPYAEVHERVKAYRKVYPQGGIIPEMIKYDENICIYKCKITDEVGAILAQATASEKIVGNAKKDYINITNMIENCETSAVGRALGFAGFGVDTAIASAEEIKNADSKREQKKASDPMNYMPIQEGQKQWLVDKLTEQEIKNAIANLGHKKLSELTYAEAESLREFKENQLKEEKEEKVEVF